MFPNLTAHEDKLALFELFQTDKATGIFRLKYFPNFSPFAEAFYVIQFWTLNKDAEAEGTFGYGTALYLLGLTTYVPQIIDVIVPRHFNRNSEPRQEYAFSNRLSTNHRSN